MSSVETIAKAPTDKGSSRVISILEAAKTILVVEGFSGLSYRTIAKQAGIAVGNVNYYYPSKDDLMVDLANYIFDRWGERFQKRVSSALTDDREIFMFSVRFMIAENKRDRTITMLMDMWAFANHSPSVARMVDAFYAKMRTWIGDMIRKAKPELSERDLALRAGLVTVQIEGLMILIGPKRLPHEELAGLEAAAALQIEKLAFGD